MTLGSEKRSWTGGCAGKSEVRSEVRPEVRPGGVKFKPEHEAGFTLVEVMAVMVILAILAAIAIPKLTAGTDVARRNADVATAHELKSALDRYQVENGVYPTSSEISISSTGVVTATGSAAGFIPRYINKLDSSTTQQKASTGKGFGVATLPSDGTGYTASNLIMIYLMGDGSAAEVRAYDSTLNTVLWTSTN